MDKEQFWNIVNEVHSSTDPRNQKEVLAALRNRLRNLPSEEILEWKQIFSFYQDAARRNDLWAASAAMGAHSSDDGFMDFRSWLISQGHDVYMSALEDPESLVSVDTDGQELNFEDYEMTQSTRKLTMGSLFDGISGFPLASVRCGIEPIWASEIEPFPILVSKIRFPRMEQMGDITKLNGAYLPPVDIICGGSPCQDSAWPECVPG